MLIYDSMLVLILSGVGFWLEGINGKHGYMDEILAPLPLGLAGLLYDIGRYVA